MHAMHGKVSPAGLEATIATLAATQYGVVTRTQLVNLGLGRGAIDHRVRTGRLHRLHRGVYSVGHVAQGREARWLAAVLACGDGALLSHRSAAALWGMRATEGTHPDVTVPRGRRCTLPDLAVHHSRLVAADRASRSRVPATSPARTLVDLAFVLSADELARTLREAQFLRIFNLAATRAALARRPSRVLGQLLDDLAVTQSALEDRLLLLCDRHRIPRPLTQRLVLGRRVDFLWPAQRVIVETDGWQAHGTAAAFQADRTSTNAMLLAGYVVLRFTHADVMRRSARVAREIRTALAARDSDR
jgi:very-short-patch-repair endonuclease